PCVRCHAPLCITLWVPRPHINPRSSSTSWSTTSTAAKKSSTRFPTAPVPPNATTVLTPTAAFRPCLCTPPRVAAKCRTATSSWTVKPRVCPATVHSSVPTSIPASRVLPCKSTLLTSRSGACWRNLRRHSLPVYQPSSNQQPQPVMSPKPPCG